MPRSATNMLDLSGLPVPQRREAHDFVPWLCRPDEAQRIRQ